MKTLLGPLVFAFLAVACLKVPADLTLVVEEFDGYHSTRCGRYDSKENVIHINEDCTTPAHRLLTVTMHELCHAHQDVVAEDESIDVLPRPLWGWLNTEEGESYAAAIEGRPLLYHPNPSIIEDFAIACARFYTNPEGAARLYPVRYEWMKENLPPVPPEVPPSVARWRPDDL